MGPGDVERIGRLALELGAAREARAIHLALARFVRETTPMTGLFVARYDPSRQVRTCEYAWTDGEEIDAASLPPMPMNDGPASQAVLHARTVVTDDYAPVLKRLPRVDVGLDRDPRLPQSSVVVPMLARGRVLGAMEIQSPEKGAFGDREVAVLQMAAGLAALALENIALLDHAWRSKADLEARVERAMGDLREQAVARALVRRLLQGVARRAQVRPQALRELGRELARGVGGSDLATYASAYASMGLGDLRVATAHGDRHEFAGRDLLEFAPMSARPTCEMSLGFLEGAAECVAGPQAVALGAEVACQSTGHAECRFVVAVRRAPAAR